jgi:hypothetical protein
LERKVKSLSLSKRLCASNDKDEVNVIQRWFDDQWRDAEVVNDLLIDQVRAAWEWRRNNRPLRKPRKLSLLSAVQAELRLPL